MLRTFSGPFAALALLLLIFSGCAAPQKMVHADYGQRVQKIRTIGMLDPDVAVYQLSAGHVAEKIDTWSEQGKRNFIEALNGELSKRAFAVKIIAREGEFRESMEEIAGLFNIIIYSLHFVSAPLSRAKHGRFDYSVGPLDEILDASHVDSLLLVRGVSGRSGLLAQGATSVEMALADRDGTLLWYEEFRLEGGSPARDLRRPESVKKIVKKMLASLPEAAR